MIELSGVGVITALAAGAISFLSPCVLPLVPGYISYIAGRSVGAEEDGRANAPGRTFGLSLCFVLGFTTVFVLLGAGANAVSQSLLSYRFEANLIGGAVVIVFGLVTAGALGIPLLMREARWYGPKNGGSPLAAYLLGLAFAFGWTPCIGPVLGAILMMSASGAVDGVALLAIYSFGLGIPFVIAAVFLSNFVARLHLMRRAGLILRVTAGIAMVFMGAAMMTGHLTNLAIWFLKTFPALGQIG